MIDETALAAPAVTDRASGRGWRRAGPTTSAAGAPN